MRLLFGSILLLFASLAHAQSTSYGVPLPGLPRSLGPKPSSGSTSVILSPDQPALTVTSGGLAPSNPMIRNVYGVIPVNTVTPLGLITATATDINGIEVFDSSGRTMSLIINGTQNILIPPGGNGFIPAFIAQNSSISIQAVSGNATSGEVDINFYD